MERIATHQIQDLFNDFVGQRRERIPGGCFGGHADRWNKPMEGGHLPPSLRHLADVEGNGHSPWF